MDTLTADLIAGSGPDIFFLFPGTKFHPLAEASYLMSFTNQVWVDNLLAGAKNVATYNGEVYGLPIDLNVISVIYNKGIFTRLGLRVPVTWDEFKTTAETIKNAGIVPLAAGLKDGWVAQLIPYAMAPTAIYKTEVDFDPQMYQFEKTFSGSAWERMMTDYIWMQDNNYFQELPLEANFSSSIEVMAAGEAAMMIQGSWAIEALKSKGPDKKWGMFPFPYSDDGINHVSIGVGGIIAASANTKHPEVVKAYIEFWSQPGTMEYFLTKKGAFPTLKNLNPSLEEEFDSFLPHLKQGNYNFLDQNWPPGVQDIMMSGIVKVLAGSLNTSKMLQEMDRAFIEGVTTQQNNFVKTINYLHNPDF